MNIKFYTMITLDNIENIQKEWGDSLVKLGSLKNNRDACEKEAESLLNKLYGYNNGTVLFKPTKAKNDQFRLTFEGAKSYFIVGTVRFQKIADLLYNHGQTLGLKMLQLF